MTPETRTAFRADVRFNAERIAPTVIGRTITVQIGEQKTWTGKRIAQTVKGKIVECAFARFHETPCTVAAVWRVVLTAGANDTRHTVHLRRIPRS